jgi:hypothetical protein
MSFFAFVGVLGCCIPVYCAGYFVFGALFTGIAKTLGALVTLATKVR